MHPITQLEEPLIVIVAPSGAGKNTLIRLLMDMYPHLFAFFVSATTRKKRDGEQHGKEYYFYSSWWRKILFMLKVRFNHMLEYERVYRGKWYATPISEIKRIHDLGRIPIADVDVHGAARIKRRYPNKSLLIFIAPPSLDEAKKRIIMRDGMYTPQTEERLARFPEEMSYANKFDAMIVNDDLHIAVNKLADIILNHPLILPYKNKIESQLLHSKTESKEKIIKSQS